MNSLFKLAEFDILAVYPNGWLKHKMELTHKKTNWSKLKKTWYIVGQKSRTWKILKETMPNNKSRMMKMKLKT